MKMLIALLCLLAASARADLSTHPVFKHYIGDWKASGELKGDSGNPVTITEEWTGKADGDNGFLIEGTRVLNGNKEAFKWVITHNAGADSFEAVISGADPQQTIRFEGNVSTVNMTLELKAVTGNGSSGITINDSFEGDTKEVMLSKVILTGEAGQTTLEGTIKHEKQKAP